MGILTGTLFVGLVGSIAKWLKKGVSEEIKYIHRDGFQLGYDVQGQGQPILILGSVVYYRRVFSQKLRKLLQLIFIDHRGFSHGPDVDVTSLTMDVIVEDIEYMRQYLGLDTFVLVGHSGHAYVALAYAKKYPQHVKKLVLIAVGPEQTTISQHQADQYFYDTACPKRKAIFEENLKKLGSDVQTFPEKSFTSFYLRFGARSWYKENFDAAQLWQGVYVNMPILDHMWAKLFTEFNVVEHLQDIQVPILLTLGIFDYFIAPFYMWYPILSVHQKDITVRLFDKSGHCPQLEQQDVFDTEFCQWIEKKL